MAIDDVDKLDLQLDGMQEMLFQAELIVEGLKGTDADNAAYQQGLEIVKELSRRYHDISQSRLRAITLRSPYG